MNNLEQQNPVSSKSPATTRVVITAIIIIIVGTIFFMGKTSTDTTSQSNASSSPVQTNNMIPYQYGAGNELQFSFPANWYPHDKHGRLFLLKEPNTPDKLGTEIYAYGQQITVSDWNLTDNQGNRLTRAQYDRYLKNNPPADKDIEGNPIYRTNVTINGIPMTRIDQLEYVGTFRTLSYQILKDELIYEIRLYPYEPDNGDTSDKQNIIDFDKLINTVSFAE